MTAPRPVLRPYQSALVTALADKLGQGKRKVIGQLATGGGKCFAPGTLILMHDGSRKKVEDIKEGDQVMGPDSKPRNVLSLCIGIEQMYNIIPVKGDPYTVNGSHILSLKKTNDGSPTAGGIVNISVHDYLKQSKTFKHIHKGWRTGVDFPDSGNEIPISPYLFGVWLGDGTSGGPSITKPDEEILQAVIEYAQENGCHIRTNTNTSGCPTHHIVSTERGGCKGGSNPFLNALRETGVLNNKHIPQIYLTASRHDRLQLLAGLLDTDGFTDHGGIDFVFKQKQLAEDVAFLCRSLGFAAYVSPCTKTIKELGFSGEYFRISVSGDCSIIPARIARKKPRERIQKKSHLVTGIKVEKAEIGIYCGFEIDGDHLFLLGDFTVTHNSMIFAAICDRFLARNPGSRILILVHREELLKQARKTLLRAFDLQSHPLKAGTRWIPDVPVYVGMVESAYRRLSRLPEIGLVIIDECHLNLFAKHHEAFPDAYVIGFTATPLSAQKKKPLNGLYEDIVCGPQISDLIAQGALVQNITIAPKEVVNRAELALKSSGEFDEGGMAKAFKKYVKNCVAAYEKHAAGTKTIVFNVNIDHSKEVCAAFVAAGYPAQHLDGTETPYRRAALLKWFHDTPDAILCNVAVATTGFDEPSIETVIVNRATTSMPLWLQMTGRGSRPHEGKAFFRILDMGGNAITLGDWCSPRDWADIFHNPPKPGKGGVAPVKSCPQCDAIVPAGVKNCPYCGCAFEHPEDDTLEEDLREFVVVTRGIDVPALMARNSERKKYYTFFHIGRKIAEHLHKRLGGRPLTEQHIRIAQRSYEQLAAQWCAANKRPMNDWHKKRAAECLTEELRKKFGRIPSDANPICRNNEDEVISFLAKPIQWGDKPTMAKQQSETECEPITSAIKPLAGIQPLNLMNAI